MATPPNPALQQTASREIVRFLKVGSSALAAAECHTVGRLMIALPPIGSVVLSLLSGLKYCWNV
jgi:hypothetical protein